MRDTLDGWNLGLPKENVKVRIRVSDWSGTYETTATRIPYKRPAKGQCKKGFRKGARWVGEDGKALTRKELPDSWLPLTAAICSQSSK